MSLENSRRLYKHFMGTKTHDEKPKEPQLVEADRVANRAWLGYGVDITPDGAEKKKAKLKEKE